MESAKVVLVTNVGMGYGRAVALAYGRAKYHVVCADRDVDLAAKTAAEVEELGGQAIPIQADMTTQMDVLASYHKVMEIFGALGGVVHLASHVSTTPFEDLAESEFFELLAENVRSTYLAMKAAARLLSGGWVVVVAPPALDSVQMHTVQGALKQMVLGFSHRFAYPRVNLVIPSRAPSDPRHDQALVRTVRFLGSPEATGVSGQVVDVELPLPPRVAENLLPEVLAALDESARQSDEDTFGGWGAADDELEDTNALLGAPGLRRPGRPVREVEADDYAGDQGRSGSARQAHGYPGFGPGEASGSELGFGPDHEPEPGFGPYAGVPDGGPDDDMGGDPDDDSDYWASDMGLPEGPALRHLVAEDGGGSYASDQETANDLYGDLRRLDGLGLEGDDPAREGDAGDQRWPGSRRRLP